MMRKSSCLLCGSPLTYLVETRTHTCKLCNGQFYSDAVCRQGHFVCASCRSAPADEMIEKVCIRSTSTRPVELADSLLNILSVPIQGPVNQYLVPAVLLTAYYNELGDPQGKVRKLGVTLDVPESITRGIRFYNQDCLKENCPFRPGEN